MLHIATYFPDYWGGKHRGANIIYWIVFNVGVTELPLNRRDIAGFLNEVAGVMERVTLDAGQTAYLVEPVLITLGLRRPSPWALVAAERNRAMHM